MENCGIKLNRKCCENKGMAFFRCRRANELLTALHGGDDLNFIAVLQKSFGVGGFGDEAPIARHGDHHLDDAFLFQAVKKIKRRFEVFFLAVDDDFHHAQIPFL